MKWNFTGRGDAASVVDRALEEAPDLLQALRMLLRARAAELGVTETSLVVDGRSTRTWANHLAGRPISTASFIGYREQLATTPRQKDILNQLYAAYVPKVPAVRAAGLAEMLRNAGVDETQIQEFPAFRKLVDWSLDGRLVELPPEEVLGRANTLGRYLARAFQPGSPAFGVRVATVAFAIHSAAYARTDASLQHEALRLLSGVAYMRGDPLFDYIHTAIRLYWVNSQDRSIHSADSLSWSARRYIVDGFAALQSYAREIETHAVQDYGVVVGQIMEVMEYNIASLLIEIDPDNLAVHARVIDQIAEKDADLGLPATSTIYNALSQTEAAIRFGDLERAEEVSRTALASWTKDVRAGAFQEKQILIKRIRIGVVAKAAGAASAHLDHAFDAMDRLHGKDDGTLGPELVTAGILLET